MAINKDTNPKSGRKDLPMKSDGTYHHGQYKYLGQADCDLVREVMGRGDSLSAVCAEMGVSMKAIYSWRKAFPEFDEAVLEGLEASKAWWEAVGKRNLEYNKSKDGEPGFREGIWKFTLATRFSHEKKDEEDKDPVDKAALDLVAALANKMHKEHI